MSKSGTPERERTEAGIPVENRSQVGIRSALRITESQFRVLVAIERHLDAYGYPPTVRGLCDALDVSSTNGMVSHLDALARKGYIEREAGTARGIRVIVASKDAGPPMPLKPLAKSHACPTCAAVAASRRGSR